MDIQPVFQQIRWKDQSGKEDNIISADNFITVERKGLKWIIKDGCASTDMTWERKENGEFNTRDEAIDAAQIVIQDGIVEYGLSYIEPIDGKKK